MRARRPNPTADIRRRLLADSGFTLIELVLATLISTLVVGMLSVCLSFALRAWESVQDRKPDQTSAFLDLFKEQLAEFDPTPIRFADGLRPLFAGQPLAIAFATAHSVKAISHGVPVIARYVYDPKSRVLYYAEMPFDPYHPKLIEEFLQSGPTPSDKRDSRFHAIDLPGFSLGYAGKEQQQFAESWEEENQVPVSVLLRWNGQDSAPYAQILMVNSPFAVEAGKQQTTGSGLSGVE